MPMPGALDSYRRTQVQSATPLELVAMLYDGALRFLDSARTAIEQRNIAARRTALSRVFAIISELQSTLNLEQGGEIAASLDRLYDYANMRLLDAAMRNDVAAIEEVKTLFGTLRDGWHTISKQPSGASA
jgi:flagellar protein FliS